MFLKISQKIYKKKYLFLNQTIKKFYKTYKLYKKNLKNLQHL